MEAENKLYVGNLPYSIDDKKLRDLFAPFGEVAEATIISDKFSGRPKGFGFVTMASKEEAEKAISEMNGKDLEGRSLVVNVARPMRERPRR